MSYDFNGKVAIVTGAGSGIGRAASMGLASGKARVALVDINEENAKLTQEMISKKGGTSLVVQMDLRDLRAIRRMVDKVLQAFGDIDILANIAAIYPSSPLNTTTEEYWDNMLDVNLKGVFFTCQAVLGHMMEKKKGVIVNIASGIAYRPTVNQAAYAASKGGIVAMSRVLALEAASSGVRVNVVSPGATDTEGLRILVPTLIQDPRVRQYSTRPLLGRLLVPEEVAEAILWACSDQPKALIGSTIHITGGDYMP